MAEALAALGDPDTAVKEADTALRLVRQAHAYPNAITGDLCLSAAVVRAVADPDDEEANSLWGEATKELEEACGAKTADTKVATFMRRSRMYWQRAGTLSDHHREGVLDWLDRHAAPCADPISELPAVFANMEIEAAS